jgi:hypothetical protein
MAGLKVFVSSTCVDLGAQRAQVRTLLERMGYEPVMSEHSDVLFDHRMHTHTSCIKEIANADMVILLIGSRFGGTATPEALADFEIGDLSKASSKSDLVIDKHKLSVTQVEVMKAIESDVPLFAFVDSKVYSDHHLYQKNKEKTFAQEITYPSIEKPNTAKYIFEFITFITHRFSNNAITPYAGFSDIEDHLIKQWSMMFQRLVRDERDKSIDGRRADAMLEQIQDLKAVVLQSIGAGSGRDVARSVLRYRRLADFLLALRVFNPELNLADYNGTFDGLLTEFGIVDVRPANATGNMAPRTILIRNDDTHLQLRVPDRRFSHFAVEWKGFSQLEKDTKTAVLEGVEDSEAAMPPIFFHVPEPYREDDHHSPQLESENLQIAESIATPYWNSEKEAMLKQLWEQGHSASQIAEVLGGVSRNAVIGKAHRLGLRSSPTAELPE